MNCRRSPWLIVALVLLCTQTRAVAEDNPAEVADKTPRPIAISDVDAWKSIVAESLSNDGKWFAYTLKPAKGDAEVVLRKLEDGKEVRFPIGAGTTGQPTFSFDSNWLAFIVAAKEEQAEAASQSKKPLPTKVTIVCLATEQKLEVENASSFAFSGEHSGWVAIRMAATPSSSPGTDKPAGSDLLLHELGTGRQINVGNVSEYAFNKSGAWLAVVIDAANKAGNGVYLHHPASGVVRPIENGNATYAKLTWNRDGDALAVLKGVANKDYEQPLYSVIGWKEFDSTQPRKVEFDPHTRNDFPAGMTVSPNRSPVWNADRAMLLFGIHEAKKKPASDAAAEKKEGASKAAANELQTPDSTAAVSARSALDEDAQEGETQPDPKKVPEPGKKPAKDAKRDEKPADLVIWHWKDPRLQSQQQKEESRDKSFSFLCSYTIESDKFVRLADEQVRQVQITPRQRWAIGLDDAAYELEGSLDGRRYQDIYVIDPRDGHRSLAVKKCRWFFGSSPDGSRFLYYEDGHFQTYDIPLGTTCTITRNVPVSFVDTEDDHNQKKPPVRPIGWAADGASVLLSDNWDLWNVSANGGAAANLTVNGRRDNIRYRAPYRLDPDQEGIVLGQDLYLGAYGEWTKKSGIGVWKPGGKGVDMLLWDDANFGRLKKARQADVFLYTRESSQESPDYYVADATLRGQKITDSNVQQKDYTWSAGARLVDYTSAGGDKLQAALFLPAGYEPGKRYPTIVYIYEKLSSQLHRFAAPRIGGFSPSIYTSQGYAVLMPDITYKINDPGLSAVGCVLPAVEAAEKTGVVDPQHVGLHGHSWGGYQTAFLITQTDKFAAAVAGAPLTNMISMYSSIYWNTGLANQPIFESSQGRFTGGYWENIQAYTRNSPVYYATRVQTPLLLLHNDQDGAVDWNQGIEYFNTLRRLLKPVVMLQYKGENHGLAKRENRLDYSSRMLEFFDHHLKGRPAPKWWLEGISHLELPDHLKQRAGGATAPAERR